MRDCPNCGVLVDDGDTQCRYCGHTMNTSYQQPPNNAQQPHQPPPPPNQQQYRPQYNPQYQHYTPPYSTQQYPPGMYRNINKTTAGILAILLGGIGVHKFYMGKIGLGIVYIIFCLSGIPAIIGLVEGIVYLCMDDFQFREKYCRLY